MNRNFQRICCSTAFLFVCLCLGLNLPLRAMPSDTNSIAQASIQDTPTKAQFTLAAPYRNIFDDIHWSSNVTRDQVIAIWGRPDAYAGTNNFFWIYRVKDQEAWLGFDTKPPYRLAALRSMPPTAKAVPERRIKKLSDLTITNGITYQQVTAAWGRPDYFPQTGISYCSYRLEHGREAWFEFDYKLPYRALGALLFDQKGGIKDLFSSTQGQTPETSTNFPVKRTANERNISDIYDRGFPTRVTENQVIAVWGLPEAYAGTNDCYWVYYVGDKEQWIEFKTEPPHYFMPVAWMPPAAKVVPERRTRKLSDLTITNGITYEQVTAVWGRPDYFPPTGTEYFAYLLENGQEVWFEFDNMHPPYRSLGAIVVSKKGTR
jgi:hypothetical protein